MTEWLTTIAAVIGAATAVIAAWIGLRTFSHQRTVNDVNLALNIFAEINRYWDRLNDKDSDYDYNLGQILAYFEIAANMFRNRILTKAATDILGDHIEEVYVKLQSSDYGKNLIDRCRSAETTFKELKKFIEERKLPRL